MRWVIALVVVGACNWIHDLDATTLQPEVHDVDGDTFEDEVDNCPGIANDQADGDEDGVGDACDSCPAMPGTFDPADEDDDGIVDTCDSCPGRANRNQADADGDGIGDACDQLASAQSRVLFDNFIVPAPAWVAPWPAADGAITPVTFPSEMRLRDVRLTTTVDREWMANVRVDLVPDPSTPGLLGIRMRNPTTGSIFECGIRVVHALRTTGYFRYDGGTIDTGNFDFSNYTTSVQATVRLVNGKAFLECSWDAVRYVMPQCPTCPCSDCEDLRDVELSLHAEIPQTLRYFDLIR